MNYSERLIRRSNYWYNDGLKKANIRDLSGAVISLRRSLQFHRENIAARNLLGLVYYGRGEVAEALVEWIISKNFKTAENVANYFIGKVQESPGELDTINQAVKKYNQSLTYCQQNGEDLALIQLKKVVVMHPFFLKAWQLLALLYMENEQYSKARQALQKARKLDVSNDITLSYLFELSQRHDRKLRVTRERKGQAVSYNLGNETIIQPASVGIKENMSAINIMNILIGVVVGAAVVWFLIAPQMAKSRTGKLNKEIIAYSDQISAQNAQIDALKKELSAYRANSDSSETALATAQETASSYEMLINVKEQYDAGETSNSTMVEALLAINRESFGDTGKMIYDEMANELFPVVAEQAFAEAQNSYESADYGTAIDTLTKVLQMQADYGEGRAMLLLGNAYAHNGDKDNAKQYYQQIITNHPDTEEATAAKSGMDGTIVELDTLNTDTNTDYYGGDTTGYNGGNTTGYNGGNATEYDEQQ